MLSFRVIPTFSHVLSDSFDPALFLSSFVMFYLGVQDFVQSSSGSGVFSDAAEVTKLYHPSCVNDRCPCLLPGTCVQSLISDALWPPDVEDFP